MAEGEYRRCTFSCDSSQLSAALWSNLQGSVQKGSIWNIVRQTETHAAEPLVSEPSDFEVERTIQKLKRLTSPGSDQVPAEVINPYPTAFPYGNGMVLHFYQQQESSTTKTVHKVINKGLKAYV